MEEVDTAVRYVVPEAQPEPINWNEVTNRGFLNILKKFSATVTKSDPLPSNGHLLMGYLPKREKRERNRGEIQLRETPVIAVG